MRIAAVAAASTVALVATTVLAQDAPPFGGEADRAYAEMLWQAMEDERMVGENAIRTIPLRGTDPHGAVLETFYTTLKRDGHEGLLAVKRNYGPGDVTEDEVQTDRDEHLASVTVMFRRQVGYDPDHQNWYWVKYLPDGSLDENPQGRKLAGRVAKGANTGCIACHAEADGGDYLFSTDTASR
jgi:hypothetical protein